VLTNEAKLDYQVQLANMDIAAQAPEPQFILVTPEFFLTQILQDDFLHQVTHQLMMTTEQLIVMVMEHTLQELQLAQNTV
jgi:hypothetical protein